MNMVIKRVKRSKYLLLMFLLPALYFAIFKYGSMFGLMMAFKEYNPMLGMWKSPFTGFTYFREMFSDRWFYRVVVNTVILNLYLLVFYFWLPVILAILINEVRRKRFKKLIQSISYIPYFLSTVVVAGMVTNILSSGGLVNQLLERFGQEPFMFMLEPGWFRWIYLFTVAWQNTGWDCIIFLAALTGIDEQLYEVADLEGAGRLQKIRYITLPSLIPIISIVFMLRIGQMLSVGFERVLLLYNPSIYETADVIQTYVYRRAIVQGDFSYGTAVDLASGVLAFVLIVITNKISGKLEGSTLW